MTARRLTPSHAVSGTAISGGVLPSFIVIGAMRAGTTWLSRHLGAHPQVFMAPQKEVHFFDKNYERGEQWYRRQFEGGLYHSQVGEATPRYLYEAAVPARMVALVPDAQLVAILRNPVDRAYSHYWHSRARGKETLDFPDAIAAEAERVRQGGDVAAAHSYVERGRYLLQLQRFCRYYERERLLVLLFDELKRDEVAVYQRACQFLGIDQTVYPSAETASTNSFSEFRSVWVRNATRRLPRPVRNAIGRANTRPGGYPPMDGETRRRLTSQFIDDNVALGEWLGMDVSAWNAGS